jgi:hypothetical protein
MSGVRHEPGFPEEIALGRAAKGALQRHYPIRRNQAAQILNERKAVLRQSPITSTRDWHH